MASLLLIDPNPATRSVLKALLTEAGHPLECVGSLIAARAVIARERPAWLLVDLGHARAAEMLKGIESIHDPGTLPVILIAPLELHAELAQTKAGAAYCLVDKGLPDEALVERIQGYVGGVARAPVAAGRPNTAPRPHDGALSVQDSEDRGLKDLYRGLGVELPRQDKLLLYCDVQRLYEATAGLAPKEQDDVHAALMANMNKPVLSYEGRLCFVSRNGFGALFESSADDAASAAAFNSAIEQVYVAQQFCGWLRHRFPGRGRQDFAVCIALDRIELDLEDVDGPATDPALRAALLRLASYATLGGQRGWSLVATQAAIDASRETCGAGEGLLIRTEDGAQQQIFEVAAVALNSTTSVHERIARILQSNSSLLKFATGGAPSLRSLDGTTSRRGALSASGVVGRTADYRSQGVQTDAGTPSIADEPVVAIAEGVQIAGYRVIRPLGKGGMAEVFLASHAATGEERVLKLLPIKDGEEEQLQRFIQEYALISQIQDANVARIFEQGFTQSFAFIAMEFLPGGELRAAMKQGLSVEQVLDWATAIARALQAVHAKGIAHRDLKPSNLMLRADGTLVLADFGIAKGQSDLLHRTINGHIVGSPYYLSPEQAESKPVDARCDLYSLGIILFEMLTGKKPYRASNLSDLIRMHVVAPIPRLPEEFEPFQDLIDHLLAKRPSERIASAALVVRALDDLRSKVRCAETTREFAAVTSEPAAARAASQEVYSVAVIGFDETEKIVLGSTLGLSVRRTPRFVEFAGGPAQRPDIFLVDARDLLYLQTMLASNLDRAIPTVLIGTSDFGTRWPVIKRPLQWTKIFEAFDQVLREQALQTG